VYIDTDIARHSCAPGGQIGEQAFADVLGRHAKSKKAARAGPVEFRALRQRVDQQAARQV